MDTEVEKLLVEIGRKVMKLSVVAIFEKKILLRVNYPDRKTGHSLPSIDLGQGVGIPKRCVTRRLGELAVADRVAQGTIKVMFERRLESLFDNDSYGYRPGRSCQNALEVTRRRCWHYIWVVDYDIHRLFANISHDLLRKAVCRHFPETWVQMYIKRRLTAPMVNPDGTISVRVTGTPQGGVLSPLLSHLFMHDATDPWMRRELPDLPWCRYADYGLVHPIGLSPVG